MCSLFFWASAANQVMACWQSRQFGFTGPYGLKTAFKTASLGGVMEGVTACYGEARDVSRNASWLMLEDIGISLH